MKKLTFSGLAIALLTLISSCSKDKENDNVIGDCLIESVTIDDAKYAVSMNGNQITKLEVATGSKELITYNYNANNLLVSQVHKTDDYGYYFDTLIYNSQNKLIKYISYQTNAAGTTRTFDNQYVLEYNAAGQIIKETDSTSHEKDIDIYEYTYKDNKITSIYSYTYNHTTKKHTERAKSTVEYINNKNNLLKYYQLPSFVFIGSFYEVFNTEYLISKVTDNVLEDDSETVLQTIIGEYKYTFDQGNVTSITEIEDGSPSKIIDLTYKCN